MIALTADVTKGIEQTFLREGFCAHLSKPVMWSKLEDLLMKYLRDDLVFIREDLKEEQKIKDEEFKQLMTQKEVKVDEITRMMHTLKSNAKAIGAIHLYEIAKEMEDRGKQKDMEYIISAYDLLKLEWGRVFKVSQEFIEQTKNILFDQEKEAKEQIQYYRKGEISEEERNILKEIEVRIDQLDFDEAKILMKRWEGME